MNTQNAHPTHAPAAAAGPLPSAAFIAAQFPGATEQDVALLQGALQAAYAGAEVINKAVDSASMDAGLETKSSQVDPVTATDRAAQDAIAAAVGKAFPDDALLGEEDLDSCGRTGRTWIVDPIDGTVNFLYGVPHYAVSVAVAEGPDLVAAVVHNCALNTTYMALRGGGAIRVDAAAPQQSARRLHCSSPQDLATSLVATGFSYSAARRTEQWQFLAHNAGRFRDIRRLGSAALDLCHVAEGSVDCYFERGINTWDFAAGALIAQEAGASVMLPSLHSVAADWELVAAAAPAVAHEFFGLLTTPNMTFGG